MLKELVLVVFGYVLGKSKSTKGAILDSIGAFFILGLVMYVALAILIAVKFMLGLVLLPFRLLLGMLRREYGHRLPTNDSKRGSSTWMLRSTEGARRRVPSQA